MTNKHTTQVFRSLWSGLLLAAAVVGCSPDDPSLGGKNYAPGDLREGVHYTVSVNAETNEVTLKSLIAETPCWILQDSTRSQQRDFSVSIPFAGHYAITFGVETPGGYVFADKPYEFDLAGNNMSLVSDDFWTFLTGGLAEGATHCEKVWVPVEKDYERGLDTNGGHALASINHEDAKNDGSKIPWEKITYGGFVTNYYECDQHDDYTMHSTLTFALDNAKGSQAILHIEREGKEAQDLVGSFSLNLKDMTKPTITFGGDAFLMHDPDVDSFDSYSATNWKDQLIILRLDEQTLQIGVLRQPARWGVVATFVSQDVREGLDEIPAKPDFSQNPVALPAFENILKDFYKTSVGSNPVDLGETTWLFNEEGGYDWMWWNAATGAFEGIVNGSYGSPAAPQMDQNQMDNFELFVKKATKLVYNEKGETIKVKNWKGDEVDKTVDINAFEFGSLKGEMELGNDGQVDFYDSEGAPMTVTLLDVAGADPAFKLEGSHFQIIKLADDELIMGLPTSVNDAGANDRYLCVKLTRKPEGGATGPLVMKIDMEKLKAQSGAPDGNVDNWKNAYRLVFQPYGNAADAALDLTKLKVKKGQTLRIKFKLSGFGFPADAKPKAALGYNSTTAATGESFGWEPACFEEGAKDNMYLPQIDFKDGAENEIVVVNETGGTMSFPTDNNSFQVCIQTCATPGDAATSWLRADFPTEDEKGNPDLKTGITIESVSITIE